MGNQGFVTVTQHCVKCKTRREMYSVIVSRKKTAKGIRRFASGRCAACGAMMTKILPTK